MSDVDQQVAARAAELAAEDEERRAVLADAALLTLSQLGYVRTGIHDIAANSPYSPEVVRSYFADKVDLILTGVRRYKERCAARYDEVVRTSTSADQLAQGFAAAMFASLNDDAHLHRLWYDLRSQSLFDRELHDEVLQIDALLRAMIWRVVSRYFELLDRAVPVRPEVAYGTFDGIFQYALLRHLVDPFTRRDDGTDLRDDVLAAMERLAA